MVRKANTCAIAGALGVVASELVAAPQAKAADFYDAFAAWSAPSFTYVNAGESFVLTSRWAPRTR